MFSACGWIARSSLVPLLLACISTGAGAFPGAEDPGRITLWPPPGIDLPGEGRLAVPPGEALVLGLSGDGDLPWAEVAEAMGREVEHAWACSFRVERLDPGRAQIAAGTREDLRYHLEWYGLREAARDLPPEGYLLLVTDGAGVVAGGGRPGLGWGLQALRALFRRAAARGVRALSGRKIVDRPATALRAAAFLLPEGSVPRPETLRRMVDRLSFFRINGLFLVFPLPPGEGRPSGRGALPPYTPGEMQALAAFGACRGVRVMGGCRIGESRASAVAPQADARGDGPWRTLFGALDGSFFYVEGRGEERPPHVPARVRAVAPEGATCLFRGEPTGEGERAFRTLEVLPEEAAAGPVVTVDLDPARPPLATRTLRAFAAAVGAVGTRKEGGGILLRLGAGRDPAGEGTAWIDLIYGAGVAWAGNVPGIGAFREEIVPLLFGTGGKEGGRALEALSRALEIPDYGWDPWRGLFGEPRAVVPGRRKPFLDRAARMREQAERCEAALSGLRSRARIDADLLDAWILDARTLAVGARRREALDRAGTAIHGDRREEAARALGDLWAEVETLRRLHADRGFRACRPSPGTWRREGPWSGLVHRLQAITGKVHARRIAAAYGRPDPLGDKEESIFHAWGEAGDRTADVVFPDPEGGPVRAERWALLDFMNRVYLRVSFTEPSEPGTLVPVEWPLPSSVADRVIPGSGALFVPAGGEAADSRPAQFTTGPEGGRRVFLFLAPEEEGYLYYNGPSLPERIRCISDRSDRIVVDNGVMVAAFSSPAGRIVAWRLAGGAAAAADLLAVPEAGGRADAGGWEGPPAGRAVLTAAGPLLARIEFRGPGASWSRVDLPWGVPWMEWFRDPGAPGFTLLLDGARAHRGGPENPGDGTTRGAECSVLLGGRGPGERILLRTPGITGRYTVRETAGGRELRCTSPEPLAHVVLAAGGAAPEEAARLGPRLRLLDTGFVPRVRVGPVERRALSVPGGKKGSGL